MLALIVNLKVRKDKLEEFRAATLENVEASRREPGVIRFDLLQDGSDECRFALVEYYRDEAAQAAHKETAHYLRWRERAESLLAEPRTRATYSAVGGA